MSEALRRAAEAAGVRDARVLDAVARLPRGPFLPWFARALADVDRPVPIGFLATSSQPSLVAWEAAQLGLRGEERVLEVGTGTGYQAALLGLLAREVLSVELVPALARRAARNLRALGLGNVRVRAGDGAAGWPEEAPFDRILVSAAVAEVPPALLEQLAPGGRLLAPVVRSALGQVLVRVDKDPGGRLSERDLLGVAFVPLRARAPRRPRR